MGVGGLLPLISSALEDVHISRFKGQVVAIDASCWLHRGAHADPTTLALGQLSAAALSFSKKMLHIFEQAGVKALLVFDGATPPTKLRTSQERRESREREREKGLALRAEGRHEEARAAFSRSVTITTALARLLMEELRRREVPFIVAPYEADAQLAFLVRNGYAAAAVTEDSDLMAYRCRSVLYKLDDRGHAKLAQWDNVRYAEHRGALLFDGAWPNEWDDWDAHLFVDMCILSGTDHLRGVPGVGLKTAHALLRRHRRLNDACLDELLPQSQPGAPGTSSSGSDATLRDKYLQHVGCLRRLFGSASLVFDPQRLRCVHLDGSPVDDPATHPTTFGVPLSDVLAVRVCIEASVDPVTLQPVEDTHGGRRTRPLLPLASLPPPLSSSTSVPPQAAMGATVEEELDACAWGGGGAASAAAAPAAPETTLGSTTTNTSRFFAVDAPQAATATGSSRPPLAPLEVAATTSSPAPAGGCTHTSLPCTVNGGFHSSKRRRDLTPPSSATADFLERFRVKRPDE